MRTIVKRQKDRTLCSPQPPFTTNIYGKERNINYHHGQSNATNWTSRKEGWRFHRQVPFGNAIWYVRSVRLALAVPNKQWSSPSSCFSFWNCRWSFAELRQWNEKLHLQQQRRATPILEWTGQNNYKGPWRKLRTYDAPLLPWPRFFRHSKQLQNCEAPNLWRTSATSVIHYVILTFVCFYDCPFLNLRSQRNLRKSKIRPDIPRSTFSWLLFHSLPFWFVSPEEWSSHRIWLASYTPLTCRSKPLREERL